MSRIATLRNVLFLAGLSDQELEALAGSLERHAFDKGQVIFYQGEPGQTMHVIETGRVRIFILSETGQELSVNIYGPGEAFGELALLDGQPRSAGAVAMTKTTTLALRRDDFLHYLETYPGVARRIIEVLSARLRYTTAYAESLAFLHVRGRVAAKLLELAGRHGERTAGRAVELQLTQAELASLVGATRESVNQALRTWREQGLIAIERQKIILLDRPGLEKQVSP